LKKLHENYMIAFKLKPLSCDLPTGHILATTSNFVGILVGSVTRFVWSKSSVLQKGCQNQQAREQIPKI